MAIVGEVAIPATSLAGESLVVVTTAEAEASVGGLPFELTHTWEACAHDGPLYEQVQFAIIRANPDATGPIIRWDCLLRVLCAQCGVAMQPQLTGRRPRDGGPGVVVTLTPMEGTPLTDTASTTIASDREGAS